MVSALLGFMAVSGLVGHRNMQRLEVRPRSGQEFYAGVPGILTAEVVNSHRWLPVFLVRITMHEHHSLIPVLPARGKTVVNLTLTLPCRGYQPLPRVKVSSCFPVNFFIRTRTRDADRQVLVFPRPLKAALPVSPRRWAGRFRTRAGKERVSRFSPFPWPFP